MKHVSPYLNFDGNAEEAFRFYESVFDSKIRGVVRFSDMGMGGDDANRVAHIDLPLGNGFVLMASDTSPTHSPPLNVGNNVYVMLEPDSADEAERIFAALADGGEVQMKLQTTDWAEKHGNLADRFGVRWMINYTGNVQYSMD